MWKKLPDVVKSVYAGTEAAVQAEDLAIHKGGQGKVVEQVGEIPTVRYETWWKEKVTEKIQCNDENHCEWDKTHFHTLALPYFLRHSS